MQVPESLGIILIAYKLVRSFHTHSSVPRTFVRGGSANSVEDSGQRERGSECGSPIVRGSGGGCNLVQEISFHIIKFSSFLVL
jgi:hypothetical protein